MKLISTHIVLPEQAAMIFRDCAATVFIHIPKKGIRKAIQAGRIRLNGDVTPSNTVVLTGQEITLWGRVDTSPAFDYPLNILFMDDLLAVINKPSGLLVGGNTHRTIQRALKSNMMPSPMSDALEIPRPVHRLDKGTSGVLLIARTTGALRHLAQQFEHHSIKKTYNAIVLGHLDKTGQIMEPIDDKPAETVYRCVQHSTLPSGAAITQMELKPLTGRTHQIRKHLSFLGHPILGDTLYGSDATDAKRLMLHASEISFTHPERHTVQTVVAPLPRYFEDILASL